MKHQKGRLIYASDNDFDCLAPMYDELVSWAPYGKWVSGLLERMAGWGLAKGDSVLDIGCGTGLSSLPIARHGYVVTGVDCSVRMLARAREKLEDENITITFREGDLLDLEFDTEFDAAVCMHSGMDYLLSLEDLELAMRNVRRCLREGGLFAFDKCLHRPDFYQDDQSEKRSLSHGTAMFHYSWDRDERIFTQHCVVFWEEGGSNVQRIEVVHKMLAVTVADLASIAARSGFEVLEEPKPFTVSDPGMGIFRAV
jgi:ubiquinone/menaquinone biosynthesis C-methylase UbiE